MLYYFFFLLTFFPKPDPVPDHSGIELQFDLTFDGHDLVLNEAFFEPKNGDSLKIETCKFYISELQLYQDETLVFAEENSYHLLDAEDAQSCAFNLHPPAGLKFSHLQFNLGIDSLTNVSGAMGGDLDPTKGMYWTWQSGYINFKLEGTSPVCATRHNEFVYHLGGYAHPNACMQTIRLATKEKSDEQLNVQADLAKFFAQTNLSEQNQIMSLGKEAQELAARASQIFSIEK